VSAEAVEAAEISEAQARTKNGQPKMPLITGCSAGCFKFVEDFYPDLTDRLFSGKNIRQIFNSLAKTLYPQQPVTTVSIFACLAHKFTHNTPATDSIALTVNEIARMFTLAGINFDGLPETAFDCMRRVHTPGMYPETNTLPKQPLVDTLEGIAVAKTARAETSATNTEIKTLTVHGFAQARAVMDSIRKGECDASLVRIKSCPSGSC
jgi:iron only hydrogenase large subunit-like protein